MLQVYLRWPKMLQVTESDDQPLRAKKIIVQIKQTQEQFHIHFFDPE
jgi:hypothetical protein